MPPNVDESAGYDLIPIAQVKSLSETEVVLSLLQSSGISAVCGGQYNPKAPKQILVPRSRVEEANRLIANARNSAGASSERAAEERPSIITAITWILAIGVLIYALFAAGGTIYRLAARLFR
jgi:hypothetical protein